jgi:hypothetical protein
MAIWALIGGFRWSSTSIFQVFVFQKLAETPAEKRYFDAKSLSNLKRVFWKFAPMHADIVPANGR